MAALAPVLGLLSSPVIVGAGAALATNSLLNKGKAKTPEIAKEVFAKEGPVEIPAGDDEKILAAKKKQIAQQTTGGRTSTILSQGTGFGG